METKYNGKKLKNQDLAGKIDKHVSERTAQRIGECNDIMSFIADDDCTKSRQIYGNSCKNRFCPICMFRLSKKDALKFSIMMQYLEDTYNVSFIMVTLTAPNVKGCELKESINQFNKALKNMEKRDIVKKMNKGYMRKLEVTYNSDEIITHDMWHGLNGRRPTGDYFERKGLKIGDKNPSYDTYHTHFHVIFSVNKSYFTSRDYVKQSEWLDLWRDVMNDDNITQVDVRRVKKGTNGKGSDMREIAKYAAKDADYLVSQNVFDVFYASLKGRQIITFNKLFAEANRKYKAGELDHYKTLDTTEYQYLMSYLWGGAIYNETERRKLTDEEKARFNNRLVDEVDIET